MLEPAWHVWALPKLATSWPIHFLGRKTAPKLEGITFHSPLKYGNLICCLRYPGQYALLSQSTEQTAATTTTTHHHYNYYYYSTKLVSMFLVQWSTVMFVQVLHMYLYPSPQPATSENPTTCCRVIPGWRGMVGGMWGELTSLSLAGPFRVSVVVYKMSLGLFLLAWLVLPGHWAPATSTMPLCWVRRHTSIYPTTSTMQHSAAQLGQKSLYTTARLMLEKWMGCDIQYTNLYDPDTFRMQYCGLLRAPAKCNSQQSVLNRKHLQGNKTKHLRGLTRYALVTQTHTPVQVVTLFSNMPSFPTMPQCIQRHLTYIEWQCLVNGKKALHQQKQQSVQHLILWWLAFLYGSACVSAFMYIGHTMI